MGRRGPKPGTHHRGTFKENDPRRNPGGRPKDEREWKAWCKEIFNREDIRQHAAKRILESDTLFMWLGEQANGRAAQSVPDKLDVTVRLRKMTDAELEAELARELKALHEST